MTKPLERVLEGLDSLGVELDELLQEVQNVIAETAGEPAPSKVDSDVKFAWLVLGPATGTGVLVGYPPNDKDRARNHADALGGLLLAVPVVADFRLPGEAG